MARTWTRLGLLAGVALLLVQGISLGEDVDTYMRYAYRTEMADGYVETITTEIVTTVAGEHRVTTTIVQTVEAAAELDEERDGRRAEPRVNPLGTSFLWLMLSMGADSDPEFDLSGVYALADEGVEPHQAYLLPDGGLLETGDEVTVAGVLGIEAVYTHVDAEDLNFRLVFPHDKEIRRALPFPLRVEIIYEGADLETDDVRAIPFAGTIELVEFVRSGE